MEIKYTTKILFIFVLLFLQLNGKSQSTIFGEQTIKITNLTSNTENSDFGAAVVNDQLFFSSQKEVKGTKGNFYGLYSVGFEAKDQLQTEYTQSEIATYHEGPLSFCQQTGELFLTQSNWEDAAIENIVFQKKNVLLGIVIYAQKDGVWKLKESFPFNNKEYSIAHPAINRTGDTLVFVSKMGNVNGSNDLYYSVRTNGIWSLPENLILLNTSGKEMTPVFYENNLLFASDGREGKGNLDLFIAYNPFGRNPRIENLSSINSTYDDFSLFIHPNNREAYFTSNRRGGKGDDDIYKVNIDEVVLEVTTTSSFNNKPLTDVGLELAIKGEKKRKKLKSSAEGKCEFFLKPEQKYTIIADELKDHYSGSETWTVNKVEFNEKFTTTIELSPKFIIEGDVRNKTDKKPIKDGYIIISEHENFVTDSKGRFKYILSETNDFELEIRAPNFLTTHRNIDFSLLKPGNNKFSFELSPLKVGTRIELENIYYDLDKWEIRPDAAKELDKLVKALNEYSKIRIRLESHADKRGSDEYNLVLSKRRSKAAFEYLVSKGIDADRLEYIGYGESKIEGFDNETEEIHALNRKTVIEIIK